LMDATSELWSWIWERSNLPAELSRRLEGLRADLLRLEGWHSEAGERLLSLKRDSIAGRSSNFEKGRADLRTQFDARMISIADYVRCYGDLIEKYFGDTASGFGAIPPSEYASQLRDTAEGVPDYLMDWFDAFSVLLSQASQYGVEAEVVARLT